MLKFLIIALFIELSVGRSPMFIEQNVDEQDSCVLMSTPEHMVDMRNYKPDWTLIASEGSGCQTGCEAQPMCVVSLSNGGCYQVHEPIIYASTSASAAQCKDSCRRNSECLTMSYARVVLHGRQLEFCYHFNLDRDELPVVQFISGENRSSVIAERVC